MGGYRDSAKLTAYFPIRQGQYYKFSSTLDASSPIPEFSMFRKQFLSISHSQNGTEICLISPQPIEIIPDCIANGYKDEWLDAKGILGESPLPLTSNYLSLVGIKQLPINFEMVCRVLLSSNGIDCPDFISSTPHRLSNAMKRLSTSDETEVSVNWPQQQAQAHNEIPGVYSGSQLRLAGPVNIPPIFRRPRIFAPHVSI